MRTLIAIDDTDNLESPGTGHLCQLLLQAVEDRGWGRCSFISRHQLFVHEAIPYTSHNSAMCFESDLVPGQFAAVRDLAIEMLLELQAPGSDPGLCLAIRHEIPDPARLIAFGRSAKQTVLQKADAYALAAELGLHLSEHGGTGQGIVGALAGVALRLYGHDGRVKGKMEIGADGTVLTIRELLERSGFDRVRSLDGSVPQPDDQVTLAEGRIKAVLQDWQAVIPVVRLPAAAAGGAIWLTLRKDQYKSY